MCQTSLLGIISHTPSTIPSPARSTGTRPICSGQQGGNFAHQLAEFLRIGVNIAQFG
jgi:hypothetical protein